MGESNSGESRQSKIIQLKAISKIYQNYNKKTYALRDLSLNIYSGEFILIDGPSGSGKSTLLGIIGLLDQDYTGQLLHADKDTKGLPQSELLIIRRKRIGFIFQHFALHESLTVQENVELPLVFQGINYDQRKTRLKTVLEQFSLKSKYAHFPAELSGGEKQRVALARALITNPPLLFADEPTGRLDFESATKILQLLQELNQNNNLSIVLTTHDPRIKAELNNYTYYSLIHGRLNSN